MQFDFSCVDWSDDDSSPFDQCEHSSSCDEPAVVSQSTSDRTPTIRFAQEDEVFDHLHISDYTEEDINATWFRPHEFRQMRSQIQQLVHQMEQRQETDSSAMRGLEFRTTEGGMKRSLHKREAYAAVLEEQERQWRSAREDPERIAAAYQIVSSKCQGMALLRGIQDEHDIREPVVNFFDAPEEEVVPEDEHDARELIHFFDPVKPYEAELDWRRLAVLEDIKILSAATELELWHANPAAA